MRRSLEAGLHSIFILKKQTRSRLVGLPMLNTMRPLKRVATTAHNSRCRALRLEKLLITVAVMTSVVPRVYAISPVARRHGIIGRWVALLIALACLTPFSLAVGLSPSPAGVGTHHRLGLNPCQLLQRTGLPCPSCGMTTSFAWFVRGNVFASFYVQPMGFVIAAGAAMTFWGALYVACSGKPAYVLLSFIPLRYTLLPLLLFGVAAWGWKILIHLRGIDGWN